MPKLDNLFLSPMHKNIPVQLWWKRLKLDQQSIGKNKIVARKSIIANSKIKKGEIFTEQNLTAKRPGNGISPMNWYDILGKEAEKDFEEDEVIVDSRFKNQEV